MSNLPPATSRAVLHIGRNPRVSREISQLQTHSSGSLEVSAKFAISRCVDRGSDGDINRFVPLNF